MYQDFQASFVAQPIFGSSNLHLTESTASFLPSTMAWTYILYYDKNSDLDEIEVYRRIKAELGHPFEISVRFVPINR